MPDKQAVVLRASSKTAPFSDPSIAYPDWYMHRWHFLPEGYLSRRSAAGYDRVIRNVYNAFSENSVARELVRRVRRSTPESVLEVGTGPGRLLQRLSRVRSVRKLTGVDLSPYLLERAAARLTEHNVELLHGNALALPIAAGTYDVATASHFVGHIPSPVRAAAVGELVRAVRPGGRIVLADHRWHRWPGHSSLRLLEESFHAFGTIRMCVFERLGNGIPA